VGDVIDLATVGLSNPLKIALLVATPDTAPVPFIVPLTEITELQLLLTIIAQSSVAFYFKGY
jgi:hypothetical protein